MAGSGSPGAVSSESAAGFGRELASHGAVVSPQRQRGARLMPASLRFMLDARAFMIFGRWRSQVASASLASRALWGVPAAPPAARVSSARLQFADRFRAGAGRGALGAGGGRVGFAGGGLF